VASDVQLLQLRNFIKAKKKIKEKKTRNKKEKKPAIERESKRTKNI